MEKFKWDAFISHASEDKEEIAIPLTQALKNKGLKIWLDKQELSLGDSLRRKIDEGLANSRFGIVILSEHFFNKEWPQKELDALISREDGREKVILPIWHKISFSEIKKYSPLLSSKLAVSSDEGIDVVVDKLVNTFDKELQNEKLSENESTTLAQAIYYYRLRKGTLYTRTDPIAQIKTDEELGLLNEDEINLLLNAIDENIDYIRSQEYKGNSEEYASKRKRELTVPLYNLSEKITKIKEAK